MITLGGFVLAYIGFVMLAMTQSRPRKLLCEASKQSALRKLCYQCSGSLLLLCSLILIIADEGWSFGSIVWGTIISLAAISVTLTITFATESFRKIVHVVGL